MYSSPVLCLDCFSSQNVHFQTPSVPEVLSHCTACTEMLAFLKKTFNPPPNPLNNIATGLPCGKKCLVRSPALSSFFEFVLAVQQYVHRELYLLYSRRPVLHISWPPRCLALPRNPRSTSSSFEIFFMTYIMPISFYIELCKPYHRR